MKYSTRSALVSAGWFRTPGAYVLVDGQFGSTGKGLLASVLAEFGSSLITHVTTNAGPNSGHTAYCPETGQKIVTQQLPIASVVCQRKSGAMFPVETHINGGAIIDVDRLHYELDEYDVHVDTITVHPHAAVISDADRETESQGSVAAIASTGKGTGAALARKILRDPSASYFSRKGRRVYSAFGPTWDWSKHRVFVETAQGFSLGINSGFYPNTTSRECSVQQALSDARIPARKLVKVAACYRTFPIRVGNTAQGDSGPGYGDQREVTWEEIGQQPERTTVTNRVRRVFTWSREQFKQSVRVNEPDLIFLNFMNYLPADERMPFVLTAMCDYREVLGRWPETVLLGYGPYNKDVTASVRFGDVGVEISSIADAAA